MKNQKLQKGFTLLEALVAVSILMVAVAAPITIAQKGLSSAVYSKDQMIASYLAQDAIEFVKNKRDEFSIRNSFDWGNLDFIDSKCLESNSCDVDTISGDIIVYSSNTPLKKSGGFYGHQSGSNPGDGPTKFYRKVNIQTVISGGVTRPDEALITVIVSWGSDSVVVKDLIYNI